MVYRYIATDQARSQDFEKGGANSQKVDLL
jgi:hypothetical protein